MRLIIRIMMYFIKLAMDKQNLINQSKILTILKNKLNKMNQKIKKINKKWMKKKIKKLIN